MNKKLVAVAVAGVLAAPLAAQAPARIATPKRRMPTVRSVNQSPEDRCKSAPTTGPLQWAMSAASGRHRVPPNADVSR